MDRNGRRPTEEERVAETTPRPRTESNQSNQQQQQQSRGPDDRQPTTDDGRTDGRTDEPTTGCDETASPSPSPSPPFAASHLPSHSAQHIDKRPIYLSVCINPLISITPFCPRPPPTTRQDSQLQFPNVMW